MRLYALQGTTRLTHDDTVYDADEVGGFDLPEDFGRHMHAQHLGGRPLFEDEAERDARLKAEALEEARDPARLYELMQQLVANTAPDQDPGEPDRPRAHVED